MRLDELPRSDKVEDRRGGGPGGFRIGRGGGIGIGTIILLGVVGWALGINPLYLIGGAEILSRLGGSTQQSQPTPDKSTAQAPDQMQDFVSAVLGSSEVQWREIFAQAGKSYEPPSLVMYSGGTRSGCGIAQSAMGPFYVRSIGRFTSTPRSSRTSSAASVVVMSEARAANSRKPT